jgi:hypothetical protein
MVPTRHHYKEGVGFEHILPVLIACHIGLYTPVFPTVLHSAVAHESMQVIPLFSTSSSKTFAWVWN